MTWTRFLRCCQTSLTIRVRPKALLEPTPWSTSLYFFRSAQATVSQTTCSVVDGIDLEAIRKFSSTFKMRRLALGLTQSQVGASLTATEGPAYSQSAICRFEKLDLTPKSAAKIQPVLEHWLRQAEEQLQDGHVLDTDCQSFYPWTVHRKTRKRRTFFSNEALNVLTTFFEKKPLPSGK